MNYTDEEIAEKVLAGEKELFVELIDRYQRPIFNLMYRYSNNSEDAAELTQDAFIRAFEKLRFFHQDKRFFSWFYKLAINIAGDWTRRNSRQVSTHKIHLENRSVSKINAEQQNHIELKEELLQVERSLLKLPPKTREIIILRHRHDCSIRDIAAIFNLSESAAKMRLKRGLEQLKNIFQKEKGSCL